jgi:hypothetical protein
VDGFDLVALSKVSRGRAMFYAATPGRTSSRPRVAGKLWAL